MWFALSLSIIVVVYNNVANRWKPFHGPAYVPLNLTFAVTITFVAVAMVGLSRSELGLRGDVRDVAAPLGALAIFALGAFALAHSRGAHRIADRRVEGMRGGALAYYVLVRIPLGTGVTEEGLFRGVLFAAWLEADLSTFPAALCSSLAFGLWHISPTIIGVRINDPAASPRTLWAAALGAVLFTTIAGLVLTWLRFESGGLGAPTVLHAGVNSISTLAAVRANRKVE